MTAERVRADLLVVGAGPAGANAAMTASRAGLATHLIDEADEAGGQVWRAPIQGVVPSDTPETRSGSALRADLTKSDVSAHPGQRVWSVLVTDGGTFQVDSLGPDGPCAFEAPRLVAATGAYERIIPFTGWTLPGVMGLAAATVLLKSHGVVPGERAVIAGAGPLLLAVAAGMLEAGVKPLALVDLDSRADWVARLPALASRPELAMRGASWAARVLSAKVPIFHRHAVCKAEGDDQLAKVVLAPVDETGSFTGGHETVLEADALLVGHGLTPGGDIPRLLGAAIRYDALRGGSVPVTDAFGRTSIPGLFAIGDGAGVRGADAAVLAGKLCGWTAALDAGMIDQPAWHARTAPLLKQDARQARFSDAVAGALALRSGQLSSVPKDAVVCRCEDVTRGEIEQAADAGAHDVNQLKHFTRVGMGPCQGRMCGEVSAGLLAAHLSVARTDVGTLTARPPLRPVALGELTGSFSYNDIPIPEPAPL